MTDKRERVFFSPEQQAKVDELIDKSFLKGFRKAPSDALTKIAALETENVSLKGRISELENKKSFFSWRRK